MNRIYEELEAIQADAVANTLSAGLLSSYELIEVLVQSCNLSICSFKDSEFGRLKKTRPDVSKHLLAKYAQLTKMDVALNNLVVRFICIHVKII